jgi:ribosomal protein S18 acetylase RimI-like enzyme
MSRRSSIAILAAIEANLSVLWRSYSRLPGAELWDQPDLFWVATNIPFPPFNGVLRAHLRPQTIAPTITTTLQHFARRHVPMLWLVGPSTQPSDLGTHLMALGLTHQADDPGMAIDLGALPTDLPVPTGFTSEVVDDLGTLRTWCGFTDQALVAEALFAWGQTLGFAPDREILHFLGRLDGRPVATATLVLGGEAAGLYNVMTLPDAQHRGIGALMSVRPLELARARGYRLGILQSSKQGYALYRRLGFQDYCRIAIYLWSGESSSADAAEPERSV